MLKAYSVLGTQGKILKTILLFLNSTILKLYKIFQFCIRYQNMSLRLHVSVIQFIIQWLHKGGNKRFWTVYFVPGTVLDSLQMLLPTYNPVQGDIFIPFSRLREVK